MATVMTLLGQAPPPPLELPDVEYSAIAPSLIFIGAALLILTVSSLITRRLPPGSYLLATVAASALAMGASAAQWRDVVDTGAAYAMSGAIVVDGFSVFLQVVITISVALGALIADGYLRREGLDGPEFYVLVLLSASGAMTMAAANDLIVLFLGLEILSIALYVLAGFHGRRLESREAAIKYFVLGSFSSALFLYGVALTYGATGSTSLPAIASFLAANAVTSSGLLLAGMVLLLVGLGFKVAAVPFHSWTPDVYQGSPSPVTGIMAAMAKAAGFAGLLRVFFSTFSTLSVDWKPIVLVLAVLSLLVGSVLAIVQEDIKRMLAYSSISHAGYVLIGLQAASTDGIAAALFYLLAYSFMVLGSFGIVTLVAGRGDAAHSLEQYRGLAARRPGLALCFTVFLMAQAGVPFTSGFFAKFYVIASAVESGSYALAFIGMLMAAAAAFFYLRVVVLMYGGPDDAVEADEQPAVEITYAAIKVPVAAGTALALALAFTLAVGVAPQLIIDLARRATLVL